MINKIFKSEKGQALVELAFILPILLMIVFGITEFGRVFGTQLILANSEIGRASCWERLYI